MLIGQFGRFLLHPMTDSGEDVRAAQVAAVLASLGVRVDSGDKIAHWVFGTRDKAGRLHHRLPGNVREFCDVDGLRAVAIECTPETRSAKGFSKDVEVFGSEPGWEGIGVDEPDQECVVFGFGDEGIADRGISDPFTREGIVNLAQGGAHIGREIRFSTAFFLKVKLIKKAIAINLSSKL